MRLPLAKDPRWFQIAFLASFAAAGMWEGVVPLVQPVLTVAAAAASQWLNTKLRRVPSQGYLSPVITGLGVALLVRSDLVWLPPACAAVAIASKFWIRINGKHVFNPANLGLAGGMLATTHIWASPSQWGEDTVLLFWFLALGLTVVVRALRTDISFAFLGFWIALKAGRVLYLGQRLAVLEHQLAFGSLIVFTFFMISDPKTTPDSRAGRILYAGVVAVLAFVLQHRFWVMNSPVWALFFLSPLVPVIDRLIKGVRYQWPSLGAPQLNPQLSTAGAR
ncbi:MAG: RnfABCDGE type electron transport complex subunit D [Deltaproteobacteria bacterium]|nr:RnfABCDGE type electron transport complex subunit D [Deltaproteobacteria bacterium]